ncbi:MAG: hypothetical protein HQL81_14770 [Magnetococcales bacterium]|nr:hypothetical protein [Magnetococcales bacterium]
MTTSSVKGRSSISLLAGATLLTAALIIPQKAHADAATATVLGGLALYSSLMHAAEPSAPVPVPAYPQASVPPPVMVAQPMAVAMPMLSPLHQPTVYSSVSPTAAPEQRVPMMQSISYQVSPPSLPPMNMPSYQSGPTAMQPSAMPQQSMQSFPSAGVPVAGFQGQGYPMMQQTAMMPQQGGMMSYPGAMMPQQQAAMMPQGTMMPQQQAAMMPQGTMMPQQQTAMMPPQTTIVPQQTAMASQGGYGTTMPSSTFAYAR